MSAVRPPAGASPLGASPLGVSPLGQILRAIAGEPQTPAELARRLGSSEGALEGMLRTLQASGYVQEAMPAAEGCACEPCALKSLCRNADAPAPLHLLRLTARGERYLHRATCRAT